MDYMATNAVDASRVAPADLMDNDSDKFVAGPQRTQTSILAEFLSTTGPEDVLGPQPTTKAKKSALSIPFFRRKRAVSQTPKVAIAVKEKVTSDAAIVDRTKSAARLVRPNTSWTSTRLPSMRIKKSQDSHQDTDINGAQHEQSGNQSDLDTPEKSVRNRGALTTTSSEQEPIRSSNVLARDAGLAGRDPNPNHSLDPAGLINHSLWPIPKPRPLETIHYLEQRTQKSQKDLAAADPGDRAAQHMVPTQYHARSEDRIDFPDIQETGQKSSTSPRQVNRPEAIPRSQDMPQRITSFLRQETASRSASFQGQRSQPEEELAATKQDARRLSVESSFSDVLDFGPNDEHIAPILLCSPLSQRSLSLPQSYAMTESYMPARKSFPDTQSTMAEEMQKLGERNRYLEATIAALLAEKDGPRP